MKHSLIQHPPGSGFARIDYWVLEELGERQHAVAAVLAQLEYWQRHALDSGDGWVRKGAADIARAMRGLYGEDKVRDALRRLVEVGWAEEGEETTQVGQLWTKRKKYRLRIDAINASAEKYSIKSKEPDFSGSGSPKNRVPGAGKSASRDRENRDNNYIGGSYISTPPLPPPTHIGIDAVNGPHLEELPSHLRDEVARAIAGLSHGQQHDVVDELIGQISTGVAKRPFALLRKSLIPAVIAGELTIDHALSVRARREAHAQAERRRADSSAIPVGDERAIAAGEAVLARYAPRMAGRR